MDVCFFRPQVKTKFGRRLTSSAAVGGFPVSDACPVAVILSTCPLHCCARQKLDGTGQVASLWEVHGLHTALGANRVSL